MFPQLFLKGIKRWVILVTKTILSACEFWSCIQKTLFNLFQKIHKSYVAKCIMGKSWWYFQMYFNKSCREGL